MQNGLLSWLLIKACVQQDTSLAYQVFGLFKKWYLPQLDCEGEKAVTAGSFKDPV